MKPTSPYLIVAALLLGCIFLLGCENDDKTIDALNNKKPGVEEATQIEVIYTIGGKTKTIIRAPKMYRVQQTDSYYEFPDSVFADFYNEQGEVETKLSALYGSYKDMKNLIYLRDSVRVVNIKTGDSLYSQNLYWDKSRVGHEFYTDSFVRIRTKTQKLNGTGLEASQDLKQKLFKNAKGTVAVPPDKFPQ